MKMVSSVKYLLSLAAIRERAAIVGKAAKEGHLNNFDVNESKLQTVADYVSDTIKVIAKLSHQYCRKITSLTDYKRDFGPDKFGEIPPHGRWQHFEAGNVPRITNLIAEWETSGSDQYEITRRLVDLFFVSVLLDAGAGEQWRYRDPETQQNYERSEGIAIASLVMFTNCEFCKPCSDKTSPSVNGKGLQGLTTERLSKGFQASTENAMLGVPSRAAMLRSFGTSLLDFPSVFGEEGRPGNIVDYLAEGAKGNTVDVHTLWDILQDVLIPIWPKDRTTVSGQPIGDAWPLRVLSDMHGSDDFSASIQPFHKLTQWLTYSLMVPMERLLGLRWLNGESLTALAEYRNGGLFVDLGVLRLKPHALGRGLQTSSGPLPMFKAEDDVIVEWRAMTIVLLDVVYEKVLASMGDVHLTLAQFLEAGTWKSGRRVAAQLRPETKSSPILIDSDGTVF